MYIKASVLAAGYQMFIILFNRFRYLEQKQISEHVH